MVLALMEVLNHSWRRNFREQLPFPDSEMQSISRINKGDIPSFRKGYRLAISCAQDYVESVRNDSREKRTNGFLSKCHLTERSEAFHPLCGIHVTDMYTVLVIFETF
jgi:hypothetical protein